MGARRDDCPDVAGTSTRDVQGCPDADGNGWSDEYGGWNAAFSSMGEDPVSSWMSYMILGITLLVAIGMAAIVRSTRSPSILKIDQGGDIDA
jgi:ABC-type dipeptide/oligopeptide/nickel transport system permease component